MTDREGQPEPKVTEEQAREWLCEQLATEIGLGFGVKQAAMWLDSFGDSFGDVNQVWQKRLAAFANQRHAPAPKERDEQAEAANTKLREERDEWKKLTLHLADRLDPHTDPHAPSCDGCREALRIAKVEHSLALGKSGEPPAETS